MRCYDIRCVAPATRYADMMRRASARDDDADDVIVARYCAIVTARYHVIYTLFRTLQQRYHATMPPARYTCHVAVIVDML